VILLCGCTRDMRIRTREFAPQRVTDDRGRPATRPLFVCADAAVIAAVPLASRGAARGVLVSWAAGAKHRSPSYSNTSCDCREDRGLYCIAPRDY